MQWQEDLTRNIRFGDERDDRDYPVSGRYTGPEFSECNRERLIESFLEIRDECKVIVEIGVHRNGEESSTHCFLKNKNKDTLYLGVDIEDKSFLVDDKKNIYTIQSNSSNYDRVIAYLNEKGHNSIDYLFIDGWHSINQVYDDWEYTKILSKKGIVGFHDTNHHPGPSLFIQNLDRKKWAVNGGCGYDWGIAFVKRI